jgi:chemotaxis protein MotB
MNVRMSSLHYCFSFLLLVFVCSGCAAFSGKGRLAESEKITYLKNELSEMERAQKDLEDRLANEIADKEVRIEMLEKGLVISFVAEVLFDSGRSELKPNSFARLEKVAAVLGSTVPDLDVGIEGHTDNESISRSGWKSNWELSVARALSVLHHLTGKGVAPQRLAVIGYGEYRPVISNDTKEGRQRNRRVEIVILPRLTKDGSVQH